MGQGLGDGHLGQLLRRVGAERAAAGRQHDAGDFLPPPGLHRLKNRAVLAVDGEDAGVVLRGQASDQRAGHHETLLVGQGDRLAGLQRRPRPLQTGAAHNRRNHRVHLRVGRHAVDAVGTDEQFGFWGQAGPIVPLAAAVGSVATIQRGFRIRACCSSRARLLWAVRATARNIPSEDEMTSIVLRPMLPVEPRIATFLAVPGMRRFSSDSGTGTPPLYPRPPLLQPDRGRPPKRGGWAGDSPDFRLPPRTWLQKWEWSLLASQSFAGGGQRG